MSPESQVDLLHDLHRRFLAGVAADDRRAGQEGNNWRSRSLGLDPEEMVPQWGATILAGKQVDRVAEAW